MCSQVTSRRWELRIWVWSRYQAWPNAFCEDCYCSILRMEFLWRLCWGYLSWGRAWVRSREDHWRSRRWASWWTRALLHHCRRGLQCELAWASSFPLRYSAADHRCQCGAPSADCGKNHGIFSVVPSAAQASILDDDEVVSGLGSGPGSGKTTELQQKLEGIKSRLNGLGTLPRIPGRRARLFNDESAPRREHRGFCRSATEDRSGTDGVSQSPESLFPGGFEPAGSLTLNAGPSAGGGPLEYEVLSWVPGRGGDFRPASSSRLFGNGVQPAVQQRRSGSKDESRDEDDRGEHQCPRRGGLPSSWRIPHATPQGSGDISHRWRLGQSPAPRAYSSGMGRGCLSGGTAGYLAFGAPAWETHRASQSEIGTRQRDVSWGRYGKAPRESTSRCPDEYSVADPRSQSEAAKIEGSQGRTKRCGQRQLSIGRWEAQEVHSEARSCWRRELRRWLTILEQAAVPGKSSRHQLLPRCLKWKQLLVEIRCSGVATSSPKKPPKEVFRWKLGECTCYVLSRHESRPSEGSFAKRCRPLSRLANLRPAPCDSRTSYRCQFPGGERRSLSSCRRPSMVKDIETAIASDVDEVSYTVLGAGPCWRSAS